MTLEELAKAKGFTLEELVGFGLRQGSKSVEIPYYDAEGKEFQRVRLRSVAADGKGFTWGPGEADPIPYGLHRPIPYDKGTVVVVEGESDCWALWLSGVAALGVPGATHTKVLDGAQFAGAHHVLVVKEPGEAGQRFPHLVATRLYDTGFKGDIAAISLAPHKDARAAFLADRAGLRLAVARASRQREEIRRPTPIVAATHDTISMADLLDAPDVEIEWLIEGLLPVAGIGLVSANPKAGKSVLCRNLALAVARGGRFLGRECQAATVLWLGLEEPKPNVVSAFRSMGATRDDRIRFHFGAAPAEAYTWLEDQCRKFGATLVIIDTWHKITRIDNINDYAAVNNANARLRALARETGVAQIWIHHNKKGDGSSGDQVLGSQALFAEADTLLMMRRAPDDIRTARTIQRMGFDMEEIVVSMDPDTELIHSPGSRYVVQLENAREAIKLFLAASPGASKAAVVEGVEGRAKTVRAALKQLIDGKDVLTEGVGLRGDPFTHRLADTAMLKSPVRLVPSLGGHRDIAISISQNGVGHPGTPRDLAGPTGTGDDIADSPDIADPETGWRVQVGHDADLLLGYDKKGINEA